MHINLARFEKQYDRAQYGLDSMIMQDMIKYMPKETGTFINETLIMSQPLAGSGVVVAAAPPMGRFLYEGKKMVDSVTGKGPRRIPIGPSEYIFRYRKYAKLKATDEPLHYSTKKNKKATDHWFEAAKKAYGKRWIKKAEKTAGGR